MLSNSRVLGRCLQSYIYQRHQRCRKLIPMIHFQSIHTTTSDESFAAGSFTAKWKWGLFSELKKRNDKMVEKGLVPVDRRSTFIEWNLEAELYAFEKRLSETFERPLLLKALMDRSHLEHQEQQQKRVLGVEPTLTHESGDYQLSREDLAAQCNEQLAVDGRQLLHTVCRQFVGRAWPALPLEAVQSAVSCLGSDEVLAQVARGLGLYDLIFVQEYPPSPACLARSACAVFAALHQSSGSERAERLIVDTVATHLVGKTLWDLWQVEEPVSMLQQVMGGSVEPRLVSQSGVNTLEAVFRVALYTQEQQYIAAGYGETVEIARDEAARDALSRLFGVTSSSSPLPFLPSLPPPHSNIPHQPRHPDKPSNPRLDQWTIDYATPHNAGNIVVC